MVRFLQTISVITLSLVITNSAYALKSVAYDENYWVLGGNICPTVKFSYQKETALYQIRGKDYYNSLGLCGDVFAGYAVRVDIPFILGGSIPYIAVFGAKLTHYKTFNSKPRKSSSNSDTIENINVSLIGPTMMYILGEDEDKFSAGTSITIGYLYFNDVLEIDNQRIYARGGGLGARLEILGIWKLSKKLRFNLGVGTQFGDAKKIKSNLNVPLDRNLETVHTLHGSIGLRYNFN